MQVLCIFVFLVYTPGSVKELGSPGQVRPVLARATARAGHSRWLRAWHALDAVIISLRHCEWAVRGGAGVGEPHEAVPGVPGQWEQGRVLVSPPSHTPCNFVATLHAPTTVIIKHGLHEDAICVRSLTMFSKGGFVFGIINIIGNFGTVFVDQVRYWLEELHGLLACLLDACLRSPFQWHFTVTDSIATVCTLQLPADRSALSCVCSPQHR